MLIAFSSVIKLFFIFLVLIDPFISWWTPTPFPLHKYQIQLFCSPFIAFFHSCLDDIQLSVFERQPEKIILPLLRLLANQFSLFFQAFHWAFSPLGCIAQKNHFSFTTRSSIFPTISLFPLEHFSRIFSLIPQFYYFEPFSFFVSVTFFCSISLHR